MKSIVSTVTAILGAIVYHYFDFRGLVIVGIIGAFIYTWIEKSEKNSED